MSKHLLSIAIEELGTIRLICRFQDCGTITEVRVEKIPQSGNFLCPGCGKNFFENDLAKEPLLYLSKGLSSLIASAKSDRKTKDIEFVIPAKD